MVRSVDTNQFNNKFGVKSQDLTRSTQAGKIKMGTTKKTTIDKGLVSGASTFGDYQKASTTTGTGTTVKKTVSTATKTPTSTGDATSKSVASKEPALKGTTSSKAGGDDGKDLKGIKSDSISGSQSHASGSGGTSKPSTIKKTPTGGSSSGAGAKKVWSNPTAKQGLGKNTVGDDTVPERDDEEDGYDGHEDEVESPDKKHKVVHDPMQGITNVYSMGNKGMFAAGKK